MWLLIWWPLEAYMVVNFRTRGISRDARKLARTPTLNFFLKKTVNNALTMNHWPYLQRNASPNSHCYWQHLLLLHFFSRWWSNKCSYNEFDLGDSSLLLSLLVGCLLSLQQSMVWPLKKISQESGTNLRINQHLQASAIISS